MRLFHAAGAGSEAVLSHTLLMVEITYTQQRLTQRRALWPANPTCKRPDTGIEVEQVWQNPGELSQECQ